MTDADSDLYRLLGVPRDAAPGTIKDAYHRLAMKWHPDRNQSPEAEERFKEIATAYAILSDPDKRARYDARGPEGVAHYSHEDLFGGLDLGSIFGDVGFGFGPGGDSVFERFFGTGRPGARHGGDVRVSAQVPLETVAQGGFETVHFARRIPCPDCGGQGTADGEPPPACPDCSGTGHQVTRHEQERERGRTIHIQQIGTCPRCLGRGILATDPCRRCGGHAQIEHPETIRVRIPAGIDDGMVLRVAGHGLAAERPGCPPGDLLVVVTTRPDSRFQRHGADLWRSETLSIEDAVLGCKRLVPTLAGDVQVKIPAGTQPDAVLRLAGKGLPRLDGAGDGDLNLRLQVEVPARLSREERRLFQELRRIHTQSERAR
jgi:molecular chaperone DnaJ